MCLYVSACMSFVDDDDSLLGIVMKAWLDKQKNASYNTGSQDGEEDKACAINMSFKCVRVFSGS